MSKLSTEWMGVSANNIWQETYKEAYIRIFEELLTAHLEEKDNSTEKLKPKTLNISSRHTIFINTWKTPNYSLF